MGCTCVYMEENGGGCVVGPESRHPLLLGSLKLVFRTEKVQFYIGVDSGGDKGVKER